MVIQFTLHRFRPPITYQTDNEQFILINSTGSYSLKKGYPDLVKFGNEIMVFKQKMKSIFTILFDLDGTIVIQL